MEISVIAFVLVILLYLAVPALIVTASVIYCLLTRQPKTNKKLDSTIPATVYTIESTLSKEIPISEGHISTDTKYDNGPGTWLLSTFEILRALLQRYWTTTGQTQRSEESSNEDPDSSCMYHFTYLPRILTSREVLSILSQFHFNIVNA